MDRSTIIAAIALVGVFVVFVRQNKSQEDAKRKAGTAVPAMSAPAAAPTPAVEVAHYMGRIQVYTEKLWWAGGAGNVELAKFYRHEIKEEMEAIAHAAIVDDGVPVSEHMKVYGIRGIDALKEQFATDGLKDFPDRYEALVNTCNSCHLTCGHPELHMQVPVHNRFAGQDFSGQP